MIANSDWVLEKCCLIIDADLWYTSLARDAWQSFSFMTSALPHRHAVPTGRPRTLQVPAFIPLCSLKVCRRTNNAVKRASESVCPEIHQSFSGGQRLVNHDRRSARRQEAWLTHVHLDVHGWPRSSGLLRSTVWLSASRYRASVVSVAKQPDDGRLATERRRKSLVLTSLLRRRLQPLWWRALICRWPSATVRLLHGALHSRNENIAKIVTQKCTNLMCSCFTASKTCNWSLLDYSLSSAGFSCYISLKCGICYNGYCPIVDQLRTASLVG